MSDFLKPETTESEEKEEVYDVRSYEVKNDKDAENEDVRSVTANLVVDVEEDQEEDVQVKEDVKEAEEDQELWKEEQDQEDDQE